jgi:hypothetical protein
MCFPAAMVNALATHTEPSAKPITAHKAHCDGHAPTQTRDYYCFTKQCSGHPLLSGPPASTSNSSITVFASTLSWWVSSLGTSRTITAGDGR